MYGASLPAIFLVFRETRYPVILSSRRKRGRKQVADTGVPSHTIESSQGGLKSFLRINILRPFILLTTEPVVFFFTLLSALSYGLLFLATQSVPQVYGSLYDFTEPQTGFIQAAIVVGETIGFLVCIFLGDPHFAKACAKSAKMEGSGNPRLSNLLDRGANAGTTHHEMKSEKIRKPATYLQC